MKIEVFADVALVLLFVYMAGVILFKVCHLFDKIYEKFTK